MKISDMNAYRAVINIKFKSNIKNLNFTYSSDLYTNKLKYKYSKKYKFLYEEVLISFYIVRGAL